MVGEGRGPEPTFHPPLAFTSNRPPPASVPPALLFGEKCLLLLEGALFISVPHLLIVDLQIGGTEGNRRAQVLDPV